MPIYFQCPKCRRSFCASDQMGGTQARCETCGQVLTVPTANVAPGQASLTTPPAVDELRNWENTPTPQLPPVRSVMPGRSTSSAANSRLPSIAAGVGGGALLAGLLVAITTLLSLGDQTQRTTPRDVEVAVAPPPIVEPVDEIAHPLPSRVEPEERMTDPLIREGESAEEVVEVAAPLVPEVEPSEEVAPDPSVRLAYSSRYNWQRAIGREGGYSLMMPSQSTAKVVRLGGMTSYEKMATVHGRSGSQDVVASARYQVVPAWELTLRGGVEGFLDYMCQDSVSSARTRMLVEMKRITLNGHPGREWLQMTQELGDSYYEYYRIFVVNDRFYSMSWTTLAPPNLEDVEAYFLSFRLE